ncbi:hypothetical protein [Immundisolibacter cernigliae]|uniref:hypothetical protein n=1 Tax=Immundisolibacter cernigliae TaxID=1810504 RepID=UPI0011AB789B|nr:hypothetical protein [Immundisolibacter cernigliae]
MRRRAGLLRGLLLAVLLVGLAGHVALGSDGAARALLRGAVALAGDRLSIGAVHGNLRQGLQLQQVELRLDGVRAQAAAIDWRPGDGRLWRRHVALGRITLDELRVVLEGDGGPATEPPQLPSLAVPARVTLQALDVRGLMLTPADGAPLRLESLSLAGSLDGSRLQLGQVSVRAEHGSVDAALRLDFAGAGALDGLVQGTLRQPDGPPLQLAGSIGGSLAHGVQLALRSRAPAAARLVASVDTPLAGGPWQAHLWMERGPLAAWRAGLPPWLLALDGRARGRGADLTLTLGYRLEQTPAGVVQGRLVAQGDGVAWDVTADAQAGSARMDLAGRLDLDAAIAQGQLDWQALQWPLGAQAPQLTSPSGSARFSGRLDDWALTLQAALAAQGQTGELTAQARGDTGQVRLESFAAQLLGAVSKARANCAGCRNCITPSQPGPAASIPACCGRSGRGGWMSTSPPAGMLQRSSCKSPVSAAACAASRSAARARWPGSRRHCACPTSICAWGEPACARPAPCWEPARRWSVR